MSDLLKWSHATVTVCHSKTSNLPSHTRQVGDFFSLPLPPCCLPYLPHLYAKLHYVATIDVCHVTSFFNPLPTYDALYGGFILGNTL